MFKGQESKRIDVMLEFYRQTQLNMRMFVDLRFKHFTTLMFFTSILGAIAFNFPLVSFWRPFIEILAILVTMLFWLIDHHTSQHFRHEAAKIKIFELALNEGVPLCVPTAKRSRISSSKASNLLFILITSAWILSLMSEFLVSSSAQTKTTRNTISTVHTPPKK